MSTMECREEVGCLRIRINRPDSLKMTPKFTYSNPQWIAKDLAFTTKKKGRIVVIEQSYRAPKVKKDGVTVAKSIEFKDKVKNIGASLVKQVANATNDVTGDGTTCANVLTHAIFTECCKSVAAGMNAMDLRRGITMAVDAVVTNLKSRARMISTSEEIAQVGTISANGEREIGELIAKAMEKVGREGVITIQALLQSERERERERERES